MIRDIVESIALIAEPQDARAGQYEHLVRAMGLTPVRAVTGDAALTQLRRSRPVLIITELSLPGSDGFELLRQAMKLEPRPKTLVISAFREMRDIAAQQRVELGVDGLLATSSPMSSIERSLRRLIAPPAPTAPAPTEPSPSSVPPAVRFPEVTPPPGPAPTAPAPATRRAALTPLEQLQAVATAQAPAAPASTGLLAPGAPSDEYLDSIVREIGRPFGAVGAVLTFSLGGQLWVRAHTSKGGRWTEELSGVRAGMLTAPVIEAGNPLILAEASEDPHFALHPLVREGLLRGVVGFPLQNAAGATVGGLCLLGERPLPLGQPALEHLRMLCRWLSVEISLRDEVGLRAHEAEAIRASGAELHRAAADARAFLGAVVVSSSEGIALFDANRKLIAINEPLTQITGIDRNRAMAMDMNTWTRSFAGLVHDPQRFSWIANGLPAGPFSLREEIDLVKPTYRTLRWTARPVRLTGGAIGFVFAYAEVLTVPDATEDALEIPALE